MKNKIYIISILTIILITLLSCNVYAKKISTKKLPGDYFEYIPTLGGAYPISVYYNFSNIDTVKKNCDVKEKKGAEKNSEGNSKYEPYFEITPNAEKFYKNNTKKLEIIIELPNEYTVDGVNRLPVQLAVTTADQDAQEVGGWDYTKQKTGESSKDFQNLCSMKIESVDDCEYSYPTSNQRDKLKDWKKFKVKITIEGEQINKHFKVFIRHEKWTPFKIIEYRGDKLEKRLEEYKKILAEEKFIENMGDLYYFDKGNENYKIGRVEKGSYDLGSDDREVKFPAEDELPPSPYHKLEGKEAEDLINSYNSKSNGDLIQVLDTGKVKLSGYETIHKREIKGVYKDIYKTDELLYCHYIFYFFDNQDKIYFSKSIIKITSEDGKLINSEKVEQSQTEAEKKEQSAAAKAMKDAISTLASIKYAYEGGRESFEFKDVLDDVSNYIPTDSNEGVDKLTKKASIILTIITNIGMIIAVLMSAIIGIKYMLGSIEEKAEYKKDMIPYLVGAALLFSICTIVKVLQQFGQSINNI